MTFNVVEWRDSSGKARDAAEDRNLDTRSRTHGIVGSMNDALLSIAAWRRIAAEGGEVGEQAKLAIGQVQSATR